MKTIAFVSALLVGSALVAPAALAQTAPPVGSTPVGAEDAQGDAPQQNAPDVSIAGGEGTEITVIGRNVPDVVRSTPQIVSLLSTEDIARTGDGDLAGSLERVTGLSVVGNGFVYVRGLGDRYSLALLNGSPLPSPEPLKRVIPLDLFPTSLVSSVLVQKSYSPSYPGEFGGGVINLTTTAIPDEPFFTVGGSIGGDTFTTDNVGYTYFGSDTDILGYDDGARDIAGAFGDAFRSGNLITEGADFSQRDIQDIAASFTTSATSVVQRNKFIPPNFAADFAVGSSTYWGDVRVGAIAAGGYSNSWQTREAIQQTSGGFASGVLNPDTDFVSVRTDNRVVINGLLGAGVEFGDHQIRITNLYIHDTMKQARISTGVDRAGIGEIPVLTQDTAWFERELRNTQAVGEFEFGDISIDLRGSNGRSRRNAPYERSFSYVFDASIGDYVNNLRSGGQNARINFSDLNETVWSGGADVTWRLPTSFTASLTAGYAYSDTTRSAFRREFRFVPDGDLPLAVAQQRPDFLLSDFNIYTYGIGLTETSGQTGAAAYDAGLRTHAGYIQADIEFVPGLSANFGVRYEDGDQFVTPLDLFGSGAGGISTTRIQNDYWLPAATITWNFAPDMQLRANASKTIARPQFRELAFQLYQDTEADRQFFGNPFLTDSELFNAEARYEWFFGRDQRFTLAGFYKKIDRPIEQFAFLTAGTLQTSFANAPEADLYGAEVEVQKYVPLDSLGMGFFLPRRLVLIGNYTYSKSEVKVGADDTVIFATGSILPASDYFTSGAPLTGQSEHIANVQIGLEDTERLSQQTLILNYASDRVTNRGPAGTPQQPDIIERPGLRLDFVARQGVQLMGSEIELKFEARNLTGQKYEEFQDAGDSRIDINTYDVGTRFSVGASVKF